MADGRGSPASASDGQYFPRSHRQDGGDHGERGQDGGIAHLVDRFDGHFEWRTGAVRRHPPVTDNIFHDLIGRMAATTVSVARMVGLPTSSTASTATSNGGRARFAGIRQ